MTRILWLARTRYDGPYVELFTEQPRWEPLYISWNRARHGGWFGRRLGIELPLQIAELVAGREIPPLDCMGIKLTVDFLAIITAGRHREYDWRKRPLTYRREDGTLVMLHPEEAAELGFKEDARCTCAEKNMVGTMGTDAASPLEPAA